MNRDPAQMRFLQTVREALEPLPRPVRGLEMFARDGSWHTAELAASCDTFQCWEINRAYLTDLGRNIPASEIRCVDSISHARTCKERFGLISIDSPQGIYGDYCEHFEALPAAIGLIGAISVLTFDVNIFPYVNRNNRAQDDYGPLNYAEWFARRRAFYGRAASQLDLDFAERFYRAYLEERGVTTDLFTYVLMKSRIHGHPDFIARCAMRVTRSPADGEVRRSSG